MAVIEARKAQTSCVTIVYAQPIGGKREYRFNHGHEIARHVELNRPDMFAGMPRDPEKYDDYMERQRRSGYRMNDGE